MKTSETCVAQDETLEAPIRLTPEQLESVAAGFLFNIPWLGGGHGPVVLPPHFPNPKSGPVGFAPIKLFS